ncbi:PEP-CTERM sorting domain-containing protein [Aquabacterium humicola]|uniref:PEP-CTERM sorting domain-containing protein n=1 Tax=Aquabacterium humicola TaxID=3237377 RepID=UPI002542FFA5|nr:PEP-CTERM sorting domain-containing protein [Rubrivivax pictus]
MIRHIRIDSRIRQATIAAALASCLTANAVPLAVDGSANPLPGTNEATDPSLTPAIGGLVADSETTFAYAAYDGTLTDGAISSRVVRRSDTGTLDFYWRVSNALGGRGRVNAFSIFGFDTATYEGDFRNDAFLGGDVPPTVAAIYLGLKQITFSFGVPGIDDGQQSHWFYLRSNATDFTAGTMRLSSYNPLPEGDAILSDLFEAYVPSTGIQQVSEPGSVALTGLAFATAFGLRRRKRGVNPPAPVSAV